MAVTEASEASLAISDGFALPARTRANAVTDERRAHVVDAAALRVDEVAEAGRAVARVGTLEPTAIVESAVARLVRGRVGLLAVQAAADVVERAADHAAIRGEATRIVEAAFARRAAARLRARCALAGLPHRIGRELVDAEHDVARTDERDGQEREDPPHGSHRLSHAASTARSVDFRAPQKQVLPVDVFVSWHAAPTT